MPQAQHEIPLYWAGGHEGKASRTGSNAAWMCLCGRERPLLGYADRGDGLIHTPRPRIQSPSRPAVTRGTTPHAGGRGDLPDASAYGTEPRAIKVGDVYLDEELMMCRLP